MKILNESLQSLTNQNNSRNQQKKAGPNLIIRFFSVVTVITIGLGVSNSCQGQYVSDYRIPDSTYLTKHLPNKATFYSAVLPGLGQIYNQKYWKVPLIYGGFGSLIYYINYNNAVYNKYKDAYNIKLRIDNGEEGLVDNYSWATKTTLQQTKENWRRYRDMCIIGMGVLYVAQILDADVDAYFFDYDMTQDLSLRVDPVILSNEDWVSTNNLPSALGLRCSIRF